MRFFPILITWIFLFWLTSCATTPKTATTPQNQAPSPTWGSRVQTLSDIQNWDLKALIAIRNNAKPDDLTANMRWQQASKNYTILLFGPLGAGSAKLTGTPTQVKLETSDGKTTTASTPESLLAQQTNYSLPVSNLYYWVRGLPVPNVPSHKHFDNFNHLVDLVQDGWHIQFLRYTTVNNVDMPNKIFIFNPQINVKIIINQWNI